MGLEAAEKLVIELAAGRVGTDLKPTVVQKALNIGHWLVYLFGIVIAEDEYQQGKNPKAVPKNNNDISHYFSPVMAKRFSTFQEKYMDFESNEKSSHHKPKLYQLTARMIPSVEQQAIVKRDLLKECDKLESLSNEALEALLTEESTAPRLAPTTKKPKKKKKQKKKQPALSRTESSTSLTKDEEKKITLEEVVSMTLQQPSDDRSEEGSAWVEITKKRSGEKHSDGEVPQHILKTRNGNSMEINAGSKEEESIDPIPSDIYGKSTEEKDSPLTRADSMSENVIEKVNTSSPTPSLTSNNSAHSERANSISASDDLEDSTDTDVEQELVEAKRQLEVERLAHKNALRKEKERYENMIQSLQLRLYISENKLRTYEDAFEKHVQAVSEIKRTKSVTNENNAWTSSSPSIISRVLKQQSNGRSKI